MGNRIAPLGRRQVTGQVGGAVLGLGAFIALSSCASTPVTVDVHGAESGTTSTTKFADGEGIQALPAPDQSFLAVDGLEGLKGLTDGIVVLRDLGEEDRNISERLMEPVDHGDGVTSTSRRIAWGRTFLVERIVDAGNERLRVGDKVVVVSPISQTETSRDGKLIAQTPLPLATDAASYLTGSEYFLAGLSASDEPTVFYTWPDASLPLTLQDDGGFVPAEKALSTPLAQSVVEAKLSELGPR